MKLTARTPSIGMPYSSFVHDRCPSSFARVSSQVVRDFTVEELTSLRTKATKAATVDSKYQEALRLFKTTVEHANKRRSSEVINPSEMSVV